MNQIETKGETYREKSAKQVNTRSKREIKTKTDAHILKEKDKSERRICMFINPTLLSEFKVPLARNL